jgi:uncharacterized membrane protein
MRTGRLEAFSDGVLAIIITIMVLDLHVPQGHTWAALEPVLSSVATYLLSFLYVGIYWNNHHHTFQLVRKVNGSVLWANLGLLFCISLFPFTTSWMDGSGFARTPTVVYGVNLLAAAVAYTVLLLALIRAEGQPSYLREAIGNDRKGKISPVLYVTGIAAAFLSPWLALACYTTVALIWLVPDRRLESYVVAHGIPD